MKHLYRKYIYLLIFLGSLSPNLVLAESKEHRFESKELHFFYLNEILRFPKFAESYYKNTPSILCELELNENIDHIANTIVSSSFFCPQIKSNFIIKLACRKLYEACEKIEDKLDSIHLSDDAIFVMGYAKLKLKKYDEAKKYFDSIKKKDKVKSFYADLYCSYACMMSGNISDAKKYLESSVPENLNEEILVKLQLAILLYREQDKVGLKNTMDFLAKNEENFKKMQIFAYTILMGENLLSQNKYNLAAEKYRYAIDTFQDADKDFRDQIVYKLGFCIYKEGEYLSAIEQFSKIHYNESLISQLAYFYSAICALKLNNYEDALKFFEISAFGQNSSTIQSRSFLELGKINYFLKNYDVAIQWLNKLNEHYKENPWSPIVANFLETSYFFAKDTEKSIEYFESQESLAPKAKQIYNQKILERAIEHIKEKNDKKAIDFLDKYLKIGENKLNLSNEALFLKGVAELRCSNFDSAKEIFKSLVDKKSCAKKLLYFTLYYLGCTNFALTQYDEAIKNFTSCKSSDIFSKDFKKDIDLKLGDCFLAKSKYAEAKKFYSSSILADDIYAQFQIGLLEFVKGNLDISLKFLNKVIDSGPSNDFYASALYYAGIANVKLRNYSEAIKKFDEFKKYDQYFNLMIETDQYCALAYFELKEYSKAEDVYKKLLKNSQKREIFENIIMGLKSIYVSQKREFSFIDYINSLGINLKEITEGDDIKKEIIKSLFFEKEYEIVVDLIENIRKSDNNFILDSENLFYYGQSLLLLGKIDQAKDVFERIDYNASDFYWRSLQELAKIYFIKKEYNSSISAYEKLLINTQEIFKKELILSKIIEIAEILNEKDKINQYCNDILNGNYDIEFKKSVLLKNAEFQISAGELSTALEILLKFNDNNKTVLSAKILYTIAKIYYLKNEYNKSIEIIYRIIKEQRLHKEIVEQSFLLLAENFIAQSQFSRAKATLISLEKNSSNQDVKLEALSKIGAIDNLILK